MPLARYSETTVLCAESSRCIGTRAAARSRRSCMTLHTNRNTARRCVPRYKTLQRRATAVRGTLTGIGNCCRCGRRDWHVLREPSLSALDRSGTRRAALSVARHRTATRDTRPTKPRASLPTP